MSLKRNGPEHKKIRIGMDAAGFISDKRPLSAMEKRDCWIFIGYQIQKVGDVIKLIEMERSTLFLLALLSLIFFFSASFGYTFYGEIHFALMVFFGLKSGNLIVRIRLRTH